MSPGRDEKTTTSTPVGQGTLHPDHAARSAAASGPAHVTDAAVVARDEEWHVTVEGDPMQWYATCAEGLDVKPLYIELNNHRLQLMLQTHLNPTAPLTASGETMLDMITQAGFKVVRVKHEVSALRDGETAVYYEAHVKFDGPFRSDVRLASRDLYRANRWYLTRRSQTPFDPEVFARQARGLAKQSAMDSFEYEICIEDTNPALDSGWYVGQ